MAGSKGEYEVVDHGDLADIKVFLVSLSYRNPHIHREFELCLVLSGSVRVSSLHETRDFSEGGLFLINPHQTHEIHAVSDKPSRGRSGEVPAEILSLQVSSRWCERFFPKMAYVEFGSVDAGAALEGENGTRLRLCLRELALAYFGRAPSFEFACVSRVAEVFHLLLVNVHWRLLTDKERSARIARSDRVNRITEYIEAHFMEKISLTEIARREGLTLAYLSHFFRDNLNMSFQRFVALLRFDEARHLVELTDMPITDISLTCGFSDYRYLNRVYAERIGCTPAEFRKSRGASPSGPRDAAGRGAKQRFYTFAESLSILSSRR